MQLILSLLQRVVWQRVKRHVILPRMMKMNTKNSLLPAVILIAFSAILLRSATPPHGSGPEYSGEQMKLPENYREWVYLTTGFDMSYNKAAMQMDHHMFDNVFVNPESYKAFIDSGTWPDKTVLVLEGRMAEAKGSINQRGNFQGTDIMGLEVHVKDESRFPGKWAFFTFDDSKLGKMVPTNMECYSCHAQHAAVDTTFVQFYPTLLPIAKAKGTLSASYQKEIAAANR